jgi:hypothetical protein
LISKDAIVGGTTVQVRSVRVGNDGFLPQPALLARNEGTLWDLTYISPDINYNRYRALMIEPVQILSAPGSALSSLPDDQRDQLANTFYSDVYKALSTSCTITNRPGPHVVRLHLALSDATSSDGIVKTVATYVPYVSGAYGLGSLVFNHGAGYFAGTATVEGYITDAATGALLWQGIDKRSGNAPLVQDTTNKWLDVHHAFQAWAAGAVTKFQQAGLCRTPAPLG